MNNLLAFFMPGPIELLIIVVVVGGPLIALVGLVFYLLRSQTKPTVQNPNLAPCPDCGNLISRQATACPHCGRQMTPDGNA